VDLHVRSFRWQFAFAEERFTEASRGDRHAGRQYGYFLPFFDFFGAAFFEGAAFFCALAPEDPPRRPPNACSHPSAYR
jgi:hypothetical protein